MLDSQCGSWRSPKSLGLCTLQSAAKYSWLLIDPVELSVLILQNLAFAEPQIDLLLGIVYTVGAMADVTSNILLIN